MPFDQAETFGPDPLLKKSTLMVSAVMGLVLGIILWIFFGMILGAGLHLPGAWLIAIIPGLAVLTGLYWVRSKQLDRKIAGMSMTVGPEGITQSDDASTRFVTWQGLRSSTEVTPLIGYSVGKAVNPAASQTRAADAIASTAARPELGLLGMGTLTLKTTNRAIVEQYRQNSTVNGVDAETGEPFVALYPTQFQSSWPIKRIGEWIKHYRPDIYQEGRAIYDASPWNSQPADEQQSGQSPAAEGESRG